MPVDFDTFYQAFVRPFIQSRHGVSSPDSVKARFNLENTPEQNRVYLGTYFPRTVLESLCVFTHLFESVTAVRDAFGSKRRTVIPFNAILPLKWDLKKSNSVCRSLFFYNLLIFYFRVED